MKVYQFLILYVLITTAIPVHVHYSEHGLINRYHVLLAFFCSLNALIALWEISLGLHIDYIQTEFKALKAKFRNDNSKAVAYFIMYDMSFFDIINLKFWSKVWSTYSWYDPSYSNRESFGFFVDVGNGWSTLIPSILFTYCMTFDIISARAIGIICILKFYHLN